MMKSNSAVINTAVNLVGAITPLFVSILYIPAAIGVMGPERYGLYSLLAAVLAYFGFFEFGIGRATARYLLDVRTRWSDSQIAFHGIALTALFGGAGAALILLLSPLISRFAGAPGEELHAEFMGGILLVALMLPLMLLESIFRCLLEAMSEFLVVNLFKIASAILMAGAIVALAKGNVTDISHYMFATVAVRLMSVVAHAAVWRLKSGLLLAMGWNGEIVKAFLVFGGWASVSTIVGPVMVNLDRFWISAFFSNAEVAFYTVPFDAITKLWLIPGAIVGVLFPALVKTGFHREGGSVERSDDLVFNAFFMSVLIIFPAVVLAVFFSGPLMSWWVSPSFATTSAPLLSLLALGVFVNVPAQILFSGLYAVGRPDVPARFHLFEIPLYLLLLIFLSHWFGLPGVAVAWFIRAAVDGLLLGWAYRSVVYDKTRLFKAMGMIVAGALVIMGVAAFPLGQGRFYVGGLLFLVASMFSLAMMWRAYRDARRSAAVAL